MAGRPSYRGQSSGRPLGPPVGPEEVVIEMDRLEEVVHDIEDLSENSDPHDLHSIALAMLL